MKCYDVGNRDIMEQDEQGGYYFRHVMALTAEALHSKSDIAAELAHRDIQIDALVKREAKHLRKITRLVVGLQGLIDLAENAGTRCVEPGWTERSFDAWKTAREAIAYKGEKL